MRKWMMVVGLVLVAHGAQAQNMAGVKLGPSFSKPLMNDAAGEKTLLGFSGGFFMQIGKHALALQPEILEIAKGAKFVDPTDPSATPQKLKVLYVEIPVSALVQTRYAYAFGGPAIGVEASCFIETTDANLTTSSGCDNQTLQFRRRKFELSAVAGAGFKYPIGKRFASLEARREWGFTNIEKDAGYSMKHRTWTVFLGYGTPIYARSRH